VAAWGGGWTGAAAAAGAVMSALPLARLAERRFGRLAGATAGSLAALATVGYALPGVLIAVALIGLTSSSMPAGGGWQTEISARLQHYAKVTTDALSFIPGWAAAIGLVALIALLVRHAIRPVVPEDESAEGPSAVTQPAVAEEPASRSRRPEYV